MAESVRSSSGWGGARPNTGGKRPGSGRKKLIDVYNARQKLQKLFPEAVKGAEVRISQQKSRDIWHLIDKFVPNAPSESTTHLVGENGQPIDIRVRLDLAGGYIPPLAGITTTSTGSDSLAPEVQGTGLAPQGEEDDNSPNGSNQASTL